MPGRAVTFVVATGGGSLFVGSTTSDASGEVRDRWTLGPGVGPQRVEVRGQNASGSIGVLAQFNATAVAGPPASAEKDNATDQQSAQQLTRLPSPLALFVRDALGNPRPGVTVTFVPCATCGSVDPASAVTNANGEAQTTWTLGLPVGTQTLVATAAGLAGVTFDAQALRASPSAPVTMIALSGDGQSINQHAVASPLNVLVADALGNGVPGVAVSFSAASGVTPATINTDQDGIASLTRYLHTAGAVQIVAASTGLPSVTFNINVAATTFQFDGYYVCTSAFTNNGANSFPSPFQLVIEQHVVTGSNIGGLGRQMFFEALDGATGAFSGTQWASLDYFRELTGTLSIDASALATGSGTFAERISIHYTGLVGNWSCTRQ
jgi:hypothetical protein